MSDTSDDIRRKARAVVQERQLTSYMNATKWRELADAVVDELPFAPAFNEKWLSEPAPDLDLPAEPRFVGDWGQLRSWQESGDGVLLEWIKVAPRFAHHVGRLVAPRIEDCEAGFVSILKRFDIPYERDGAFIMIYGYK